MVGQIDSKTTIVLIMFWLEGGSLNSVFSSSLNANLMGFNEYSIVGVNCPYCEQDEYVCYFLPSLW